jgi:two-component system sensor histidine kinase GlrK
LTLVPGDAARLETALALFDPISREAQATGHSSRLQVDAELAAQLLAADATRTRMILIASALALLTVPLALLFTYWINQPIRQLEQVIRQLGSARAGGAIRIQGPREMQLLGRQLSWLRDQLAELDAQKQQFLRHISHELKTPLASLCEGADLLAEGVVGPALNPAQREIVSIVQQNSKELQRLIENLLDYNQLLHRADVRPREVALAPLVAEIVGSHRLGFKRHGLEAVLRDEQAHWVLDAGKLRAALDNLVSNAANYASQDSEVLIHWRVHRDMLEIDVANHGPLIPADETERIFEPFFQGSTGRRGAIKGSGIGLSVARECIESQGGSLRLVQRKPYSSCFRITLPRLEEPA